MGVLRNMGKTTFVDNDPNPNDANKPGLSSSFFLGKYIEPEKWNPSQYAVGVYDFSSTYAPTFVHSSDDDYLMECSQAEIQNLTKLWWDGSSANWTTDQEYQTLLREGTFVATICGEEYRVIKRDSFGDDDQQHMIVFKTKTPNSKRGALVSHANYTMTVSIFDEDKQYPEGAASMQHQRYAQQILAAGY